MDNPGFKQHISEIREFGQLLIPAGETPWLESEAEPCRRSDVVLYLGCNILRTAHLAYEVIGVFQALGIDFQAVAGPRFCCGSVHQRTNDIKGAARIFQATVEKVACCGPKQVVIWCPACQVRFEEAQQKKALPFSITHATSFLAERSARLSFRLEGPARVAVHGHVGKPQRERDIDAAVRLLRSVPRVEVMGTLSSPDLEDQCTPALLANMPQRFFVIRADLIRRAEELGADTLATIYHSCHREWCAPAEGKLPVRNFISIVAEALGCSQRDFFQRFKKLGDADAIAAMSRPVWETHGLTEAGAKELAAKYFMPKKK